ncbi:leucyl/phenylalanyl-tRNA--protein transferase [uncultured Roseovarius sp.]|uniref:leucyl/phenylalanyl-tRNA--protein transferase n=1 Tax=uncultured Roseovarius sp. TaxID=293344 RepID=UPI002635A338|nr:leucyl/phenylalanyl-tRNA--protein transferase [uncultured Roseovarius sp.]
MSDLDFSLTPEILLRAYTMGIFPMAENRDNPEIYWVDPRQRGIMPLDCFHLSRSLRKRIRKAEYSVEINADFKGVVDACADREETWINAEIRELYSELHASGHAHSLEIRHDGLLTGGVYGVAIGGAFFGESMFSRQTDASKLALAHLVDHLKRCDYTLFDTQFITTHLQSLGAREISRTSYHLLLEEALKQPANFNKLPLCQNPHSLLQRSTQTS